MSRPVNLRNMGKFSVELRGNLKRMTDSTRFNAQNIARVQQSEATPAVEAANKNIKSGVFTFGLAADRPDITYLNQRGTSSLLYFATDTFVLSAWTGVAWKTTTLS